MRTSLFVALAVGVAACVPRPQGPSGSPSGSPAAVVKPKAPATFRVETDPPKGTGIKLVPFLSGLARPVALTHAPGESGRVFVVEQAGRVRIAQGGALVKDPFLDLTAKMPLLQPYSELGLLGLAFHPDYARNGRFFVSYVDGRKRAVVSSFTRKDAGHADAASEKVLLEIELPFDNQHGGTLAFGPDGFLYAGFGDGGGEADPKRTGQDLGTLLGKIVRLDVSDPAAAKPAAGNPFAARAGARPEIWALGLHNPWNFSFDRDTGLLWVGDSGEKSWEEVDVLRPGDAGKNYGWSAVEGPVCFNDPACDAGAFTPPVLAYPHRRGREECSIIGGLVYRGKKISPLRGHYLYADYCAGWVRSFRLEGGAVADHKDWSAATVAAGVKNVSAFGADADGEVYLLDVEQGKIWRLD